MPITIHKNRPKRSVTDSALDKEKGVPTGSAAKSMPSLRPNTLRAISRLGSSFQNLSVSSSGSGSSSENSSEKSENLNEEIAQVRHALDLFLNSRIKDAENLIMPNKETSLYWSLGYAFISFLKAMMTFQNSDIETASEALKQCIHIATNARKRDAGFVDSLTSWMKGSSGLASVKSMTKLQRHAELVYAESYLMKAVLSIVHDESYISFLREGLNIRNSYNIYRTLQKFLQYIEDEIAAGNDVSAYEIDDHFTSGVALGIGCFNLMLSLLPPNVLKVVEFIGFTSNREYGLKQLESIGGWEPYHKDADLPLPEKQGPDEGLRRQFCDMALIMYHVVIASSIPVADGDISFAEDILNYNLEIYPDGVLFLYFSGKLNCSQGKLDSGIQQYQQAIATQKEWKQLHHICYWELGLNYMIKCDWTKSHSCFSILQKESNWSRAVYTYITAVALYCSIGDVKEENEKQQKMDEVIRLMKEVPKLTQKIAGRSLPVEKYVSRKTRKFFMQSNYLLLPDLEILCFTNSYESLPSDILHMKLQVLNTTIKGLEDKLKTSDEPYENFYDDYCLAQYIRGIITRLIAYSSSSAEEKQDMLALHEVSMQACFDKAGKVQWDHWIYYYCRYERACTLLKEDQFDEARSDLQMVLKAAEKGYGVGSGPGAKHKYSMENPLLFKCHNALHDAERQSKPK